MKEIRTNNEATKLAKKAGVLTLSALTLGVGLTGCNMKVNKIVNALDEGNYSYALDLYYETELDAEGKAELSKKISENLEEITRKYANNELDYLSAIDYISAVNTMGLSGCDNAIAIASAALSTLNNSKTAYQAALSYIESKDYRSAISELENVVEDDCNYSNAQAMLEEAQSAIRTEAIAEADSCAEAGDYNNAFDILNAYTAEFGEDEAVVEAKNSLQEEYVVMILSKSSAAVDREEYLLATSMLEQAKQTIQDSRFDDALTSINSIKPTYLVELKVSNSTCFDQVEDGNTLTDTVGNIYKYNYGNLFEMYAGDGGWSDDYEGLAEINTNYLYQKVIGTISVDDISGDSQGTFSIIGDGEELYTVDVGRTTAPIVINVDISNVCWLQFKFTSSSGERIYLIMSDFQFVK